MVKLKNVALFVLTLLCFAFISMYIMKSAQYKFAVSANKARATRDSLEMGQYFRYILNYGNCIDLPISKNILVADSNHHTTTLAQLITTPTYVFYFSETNCFTCVEQYLPFVKKLAAKIGREHILILGSYRASENLFLTLEGYGLEGYHIYNIDPAILANSKIVDMNVPFIFKTDTAFGVSRVYIPEKSLPDLSKTYQMISSL